MKKKILLIIVFLLISSGCTAEYNITIDKNLQVTESVKILEDAQFFNEYENSSAQRVISFIINPHLDYFNNNHYLISEILGASEAGVNISKTFESISKFKEISRFSEQFADNWEYGEEGNEITLRIKGMFNAAEQSQGGKYVVDEASINIYLPFDVLEHNADKYDEKTGVYTWLVEKPGVEKEIYIKFDKTVKDGINPLYFVIGGIIVVISLAAMLIYKKIKSSEDRNEF